MSFAVEVLDGDYPAQAAARIYDELPRSGAVVITGGGTARLVYQSLDPSRWAGLDVLFSDERCVPPDHDESNFKLANDTFLAAAGARVHRMPGELDPAEGAARYHDDAAPFVEAGFDLMLLGMGTDCHIGAMFPGSPALEESRYCVAVDRPDGLQGLTLTPPAMLAARKILLLVTGAAKAEAVKRVVDGNESPDTCPARLLADHSNVTLLLDPAAADR